MVVFTFDNLSLVADVWRDDAQLLITVAGLYPEDISCTGRSDYPAVPLRACVTTNFFG